MHGQQVIAAAQYILWDGQSLFKHVICPDERLQEDMQAWLPGPLYDGGDRSLSLSRWRFWRRGFEAAAAGNPAEHGNECSDVAARAACMMEALEKGMLF